MALTLPLVDRLETPAQELISALANAAERKMATRWRLRKAWEGVKSTKSCAASVSGDEGQLEKEVPMRGTGPTLTDLVDSAKDRSHLKSRS